MTPRIILSGRDSTRERKPMSEARRQHVHGPLLPIARPEGEPPLWQGVLLLASGLAVIGGLVVMGGGL